MTTKVLGEMFGRTISKVSLSLTEFIFEDSFGNQHNFSWEAPVRWDFNGDIRVILDSPIVIAVCHTSELTAPLQQTYFIFGTTHGSVTISFRGRVDIQASTYDPAH
jgi:hypothetical protein